MKQFEYVFESCDEDDQKFQNFLNEMGTQGWELAAVEYFNMFSRYECIFKREKSLRPKLLRASVVRRQKRK